MLRTLASDDNTVTQRAKSFNMSLAAASKHIKALESARLIRRHQRHGGDVRMFGRPRRGRYAHVRRTLAPERHRTEDVGLVDVGQATDGLPGGTRTPDLLLRRQLLYPVELRAVFAP